jgi:hypothetical protein
MDRPLGASMCREVLFYTELFGDALCYLDFVLAAVCRGHYPPPSQHGQGPARTL